MKGYLPKFTKKGTETVYLSEITEGGCFRLTHENTVYLRGQSPEECDQEITVYLLGDENSFNLKKLDPATLVVRVRLTEVIFQDEE